MDCNPMFKAQQSQDILGKDLKRSDLSISKKILIIDDEENFCQALKRLLTQKTNYTIGTVNQSEKIQESIEQFSPHLVILDIHMPNKNGYEVCMFIRERSWNRQIKIIAMSGVCGGIGDAIMRALGVDDYLEKPFDEKKLFFKVTRLLEGGNR